MSSLNEEDREDLIAYLDGEVDEGKARDIEARITVDPQMRNEAEAFRQAWDLLDYLPRPEPSPTFTNRTLERLTLRESMSGLKVHSGWVLPPWLKSLCGAAILLAAAGVGFGLAYLLWAEPAPAKMEPTRVEKTLIRDLSVIENQHLYENIESLEFLENLDQPDLFGEESQ